MWLFFMWYRRISLVRGLTHFKNSSFHLQKRLSTMSYGFEAWIPLCKDEPQCEVGSRIPMWPALGFQCRKQAGMVPTFLQQVHFWAHFFSAIQTLFAGIRLQDDCSFWNSPIHWACPCLPAPYTASAAGFRWPGSVLCPAGNKTPAKFRTLTLLSGWKYNLKSISTKAARSVGLCTTSVQWRERRFAGIKGLNSPPPLASPADLTQKRGCPKPKAWTAPWQTCWIFNEVLSKMAGGHPGLRPRQPPSSKYVGDLQQHCTKSSENNYHTFFFTKSFLSFTKQWFVLWKKKENRKKQKQIKKSPRKNACFVQQRKDFILLVIFFLFFLWMFLIFYIFLLVCLLLYVTVIFRGFGTMLLKISNISAGVPDS